MKTSALMRVSAISFGVVTAFAVHAHAQTMEESGTPPTPPPSTPYTPPPSTTTPYTTTPSTPTTESTTSTPTTTTTTTTTTVTERPVMMEQPEAPPKGPPPAVKPGLQLGVRSGYGLGTGDVYKGFSVTEGSHGFIPVIVDIGGRVIPELYVGAYGSWAHVIPKTNPTSCPEGFDCSVQDWRVGVQVDFHFMPRSGFDPYIGVNSGYEWLHNRVSGPQPVPTPAGPVNGSVDASRSDRGWEVVGLTLGGDIRLAQAVALGPFVSASLNRYNVRTGFTTVSVAGNVVSDTAPPQTDHAWHEIYIAGVRGTFNPL